MVGVAMVSTPLDDFQPSQTMLESNAFGDDNTLNGVILARVVSGSRNFAVYHPHNGIKVSTYHLQ
jgi:hypothetical protein